MKSLFAGYTHPGSVAVAAPLDLATNSLASKYVDYARMLQHDGSPSLPLPFQNKVTAIEFLDSDGNSLKMRTGDFPVVKKALGGAELRAHPPMNTFAIRYTVELDRCGAGPDIIDEMGLIAARVSAFPQFLSERDRKFYTEVEKIADPRERLHRFVYRAALAESRTGTQK